MSNGSSFHLLDREARPDPKVGAARLTQRRFPPALGDHRAAAKHYQATEDLQISINTALALGAPLLITGEPGTGKTQIAFYIAWYFGLDLQAQMFSVYVGSATTKKDLLYEFDAVGYLHAAHDTRNEARDIDRGKFVKEGPLWRAYALDKPSVLLIDEIDKAARDFPNDLLNVLDQHRFWVPEREVWVTCEGPPPVIVITSNNERRLPEAFLRRCVFHHLQFDQDLVWRAVRARHEDFQELSEDVLVAAVDRFLELRDIGLSKPPAIAELLMWLTVLSSMGEVDAKTLYNARLDELVALGVLIKDREDFELLR